MLDAVFILIYKIILYGFFPLFGTCLLGYIAWIFWVHYIQQDFISGIEFVLLEIASIDGQVHFYIRTPSRIRGLIETQMYAQYPQSQVKVAEDYTLGIP